MRLRMICCIFGVLLMSAIAVAQSPAFDAMLGSFKQAKSDIGDIYFVVSGNLSPKPAYQISAIWEL